MSPRAVVRLIVWALAFAGSSVAYSDTTTSLGDRSGEGSTPFTGLSQAPEANLFTGAATTRIPIAVPPGRKNMTPQLMLSYSSSNGPSPYGFGWDLPIGRVERSTKWGTPRCSGPHTNDFVLTLPSGAIELINDPPNSETYLPRYQEGYVSVKKFESSNRWEAIDRSGIRYVFGETVASRTGTDTGTFLTEDNGYCRFTTVWNLNRIEDPHGNVVNILWWNLLNVVYPASIRYGGNPSQDVDNFYSVAFGWAGRPDIIPSSNSGAPAELALRLTTITVNAELPPSGAVSTVRTYTLTYDVDTPDARQSRLNRVLVTGDDWARDFVYSSSQSGHDTPAAPVSAPASFHLRETNGGGEVKSTVMDMTGDGLLDLVKSKAGDWDVYPGRLDPEGFATTAIPWSRPAPSNVIREVVASGCHETAGEDFDNCVNKDTFDITGDGIPDYVDASPDPTTTCRTWNVYKGTVEDGYGRFEDMPISWPSPYEFIRLENNGPVGPGAVRPVYTRQDVIDINADGLPDLVRSPGDPSEPLDPSYQWEVYLNTGSGFERDSSSPCPNFISLPHFPAPRPWIQVAALFLDAMGKSHEGHVTHELMDFNGDGLPDFLTIGPYATSARCAVPGAVPPPTCLEVYLNTGQGFSSVPKVSALRYSNGSLKYWQSDETLYDFLDINGDGLPDSVRVADADETERWLVQLNHGGTLDPHLDVVYRPENGWPGVSGPIRHAGTQYSRIDMVDLDGDGMLDRVTTDGGWQIQRNMNPVRPNLLTIVATANSGRSTLRYQPSTIYDNTGSDVTGSDIADLPFVTWVVDRIRRTDGLCTPPPGADPYSFAQNPCIAAGHELVSEFTYQDGRFDPSAREFRGFRQVDRLDRNDPDPGNVTRTVFAQTSAIKGRILRVETHAGAPATGNNLVSTEDNYWQIQPIGNAGREQVWLSSNEKAQYDLSGVPRRRQTSNYPPDFYGNIHDVFTSGDTVFADLVNTHTDFAVPAAGSASPIYDRPAHVMSQYFASAPPGWKKLAEKWFYYDGGNDGLQNGQVATGNLKKIESLVTDGSTTKTVVRSQYDGFGNVTTVTDALGRPRTTTYDSVGLYPSIETDALEHTTTTATDYRWGKPSSVTDANQVPTTFVYDIAGRLRCVFRPGDTADPDCTNPSERYTYQQAGGGAPGDKYSWVKVERREPNAASGYVSSTQYVDALGRPRYATAPRLVDCGTSTTQVISGDTVYDAGGRIAKQYDPYPGPFETRNTGVTLFNYRLNGSTFVDPIGRPYRVTIPDNGTSGTGRMVQTTYDRDTTTRVDAGGTKTVQVSDTYGRTVRSEVYDGVTLYSFSTTSHDGAGHVLTTGMNGNQNTVATHTYDLLGRRTQTTDPDSGTWTYKFDAVGNLVYQNDPQTSQHIQFCYDELNRPVIKGYFNNDAVQPSCAGNIGSIVYVYDSTSYTPIPGQPSVPGNRGVGRLTEVFDLSGSVRYQYDDRGRTTDVSRTINAFAEPAITTNMSFAYDAADRVWQTLYPDGEIAQSEFDATGAPRKLSTVNGATTALLVGPVCRDYLGRPTSIPRMNAVTDTIKYHGLPGSGDFDEGHALKRITAQLAGDPTKHLDMEYQDYDARGMLKSLYDWRNSTAPLSNTYLYDYDFAGRLTNASGPTLSNGYAYDSTGNITSKGGQSLTYAATKPHRPVTFGSESLTHDDNGNRTVRGSHAYKYDADNDLTDIDDGAVKFAYDYTGRRVAKSVAGTTTRYYHDLMEASSDGFLSKHYVLGSTVFASRHDSNGDFAFLAGDAIRLASGSMFQPAMVLVVRRDVRIGIVTTLSIGGLALFLAPWRRRRVVGVGIRQGHAIGTALALAVATLPWPILLMPEVASGDCDPPPPIVFYHYDHLGSTQAMTNASGTVAEYIRYKPYGEVNRYSANGQAVTPNQLYRREFTGYETEFISGLQYAGARFYDPELGLFNTHDPARQFASPYTYTNWNPVNLTDPTGTWAFLGPLLAFTVTFGPLLAGIASAIDTGIRTGDPSAALGAFGAGITVGYAVAGLGFAGFQAGALVAGTLTQLAAAAGLGYAAYGSVQAAENGYYATAVVGLGLNAIAAVGLGMTAAADWQTGRSSQARVGQGKTITNETRAAWAQSDLEPANHTSANPFDPWAESHQYWLWQTTPDLRPDISLAMAHPGEQFATVDWANDPQFTHIEQVRTGLLAARDRPSILPRFARTEWLRTTGSHPGPQIRFGNVHLTYDRAAGGALVPNIHWDRVDITGQFGFGRHMVGDVFRGWLGL